MKRFMLVIAALIGFVSSAQAEELQAGSYRGTLSQIGSVAVADSQPSRIAWLAQVKIADGAFEVRNLRGFKYRVIPSRLRGDEYLGSTSARIHTDFCEGTPEIRIRTNQGTGKIHLFQTIAFDCLNSHGFRYSYRRVYGGELSKK